jgi:hypothetical protein
MTGRAGTDAQLAAGIVADVPVCLCGTLEGPLDAGGT